MRFVFMPPSLLGGIGGIMLLCRQSVRCVVFTISAVMDLY